MPRQTAFWCQTLARLALYGDQVHSTPLMDAGKPLAALVYLALAPKGKVERDHLAELLWPGVELTDARHSLRQALYRIREATGTTVVRVTRNGLEFVSTVRLDCLEAESQAVDGDGARAYELLRGNFLEGFSIAESREFESWAEAQRARRPAATSPWEMRRRRSPSPTSWPRCGRFPTSPCGWSWTLSCTWGATRPR